jgi:hypothetical protein
MPDEAELMIPIELSTWRDIVRAISWYTDNVAAIPAARERLNKVHIKIIQALRDYELHGDAPCMEERNG